MTDTLQAKHIEADGSADDSTIDIERGDMGDAVEDQCIFLSQQSGALDGAVDPVLPDMIGIYGPEQFAALIDGLNEQARKLGWIK